MTHSDVVFAALDPTTLQDVFRRWIAALAEETRGEVIAIDGKTPSLVHHGGQ
jgi:hypothetical protein